MRFLIRALLFLIVVGVLALGGAYLFAGTQAGPSLEIKSPDKFVGQNTQLEFAAEAPEGKFSRLEAVLEQEGQQMPVFSMDSGSQPPGEVKQESATRLFVIRPIGKQTLPNLKAGAAKLTITAARPVLYGIRNVETTVTRDLMVRLEQPRVGVLSTHHFVNHGGAEFVVFRATPEDVTAGVRVGKATFRAFPGSSVGIKDPAVRVAFFALPYDEDLNAPVVVFARDEASNEATTQLDRRQFPKPFAKSTIPIDDQFMQRVVPAIAQNSPGAGINTNNMLEGFLKINGDLRKQNNQKLVELAQKTKPEMMWREAFSLGNVNVEARFADFRTYTYNGKEIDRQVHLGYDLATFQQAPVPASNRGVVLYANDLGIFGNCVVIDHGLGVQSLYGHMSTMDVKEGDTVEKGQTLGRSGITGLAGGDHLHFTMLVDGVAVNPVELWDPHWMEDRVFRKIRDTGGQAPTLK